MALATNCKSLEIVSPFLHNTTQRRAGRLWFTSDNLFVFQKNVGVLTWQLLV